MTKNGIDPIHFANVMAKLAAWYEPDLAESDPSKNQDSPNLLRYLSTHPQTEERLPQSKHISRHRKTPLAARRPRGGF